MSQDNVMLLKNLTNSNASGDIFIMHLGGLIDYDPKAHRLYCLVMRRLKFNKFNNNSMLMILRDREFYALM